LFTMAALAAALLAAWGCHYRGRATIHTPPPPQAQASGTVQQGTPTQQQGAVVVQAQAPQTAQGVTVIETSCTQGAAEVCNNGIDDNCNGQIDEGCGYSSGNIQITLAWEGGADIDLYVTDPAGEVVSYRNTQVASGGHLDHDGRGACRANDQGNTVENVYWASPNPPAGNYQVELHYYGECNSNAGPTTATVSVSVGGQIIGAYNYVLAPEQRVTLLTFPIQ
ncbi:MAG: DUF2135 domain-containing protein, partial [Deltaproteobacteria bacterium]|nr:DUF2135 domain-containing protein [Deltaproteobacteria bacterium]